MNNNTQILPLRCWRRWRDIDTIKNPRWPFFRRKILCVI